LSAIPPACLAKPAEPCTPPDNAGDRMIALLWLLQYMGFASFAAGDTIFKQGDYGDHFYIILSGAVDVMVREGNTADEVCTLDILCVKLSLDTMML